MEGGVASPVGVRYGPAFLSAGGVVCLESKVEAEEKIGEVETQTNTVGHGYLFVEILETKQAAGLVGVAFDGPHVAGVDKERALEHPEQFAAQLERQQHGYVAALVYEVGDVVVAVERAGAERAHAPAAHRVGAAGIEPFLERDHRRVAIGVTDSQAGMERDGAAR